MDTNVFWDLERGGVCPACGAAKAPVRSSPPWRDGVKERFHKCPCGCTFKSIQMTDKARGEEVKKRLDAINRHAESLEKQRDALARILNYS